jgi:hypothetical protein
MSKRIEFSTLEKLVNEIQINYENDEISFAEHNERKEDIIESNGWCLETYEQEIERLEKINERFLTKRIRQ